MTERSVGNPRPLAFFLAIVGVFCAVQVWRGFDQISSLARLDIYQPDEFVWLAIWLTGAVFLLWRYGREGWAFIPLIKPHLVNTQTALAKSSAQRGRRDEPLLSDLRADADGHYVDIETVPDKGKIIIEKVAARPVKGVDGSLTALTGLAMGAAAQGGNWSIRAIIVKDGVLSVHESLGRFREGEAKRLIDSGEVPVKRSWAVPLLEVPEVIEIDTARDHMGGTELDYAARCDDVFFMHRGRRMVLGRFFDKVRDTATQHQFDVREFIEEAKRRFSERQVEAAALPPIDDEPGPRVPTAKKGFAV